MPAPQKKVRGLAQLLSRVQPKAAPKESPAPKTVALTVIASGSESMGRPVMMMPTSPTAVLNNFIAESVANPDGPLDPPSPTIIALEKAVTAISQGEDLTPHREAIERIAANQTEKTSIVRAFGRQLNYEKLADYEVMGSIAMRTFRRACKKDKATVGEALVVWRTSLEQVEKIKREMAEDTDTAIDTPNAVEKINFGRQQKDRVTNRRWEGTTPQGRELMRKKLWRIKRELRIGLGIYPTGMEPPEPPEEDTQLPMPPFDEESVPPPPVAIANPR